MLDNDSKQTRASSVFFQLRSEILEGVLLPGAKLKIRDVCDRFDAGLSPVREALNRLTAEGLVHQSDNRGFAVSPVSVPGLMDLTRARCWIDEIGLRESIARGDDAWEEHVLVSCHRLCRTPRLLEEETANPEWNSAHKKFHESLILGSGSDWLITTFNQLFDAAERYRSIARLAGVSRSDPRDEHREIMSAAVDREADLAVDLLRSHYQRTARLVRSVVDDSEVSES